MFENRPSENQDPWYADREKYDQSLEAGILDAHRTRRQLPAGLDMDDLRDAEWSGIWWVDRNTPPANLPFVVTSSFQTFAVEIVRSGSLHSVTQIVTTSTQSWWRSALSSVTWGPWRAYVSSPEVHTLTVTKDYNQEAAENQLLVVQETPKFFTDFSDDTLGAIPQGFRPLWNEGGWSVEPSDEGSGGKVLKTNKSSDAEGFLAWDEVGSVSDVELTMCYKTGTPNAASPMVRASQSTLGRGVAAAWNADAVTYRMAIYRDSRQFSNANASVVWGLGWMIARIRVFNGRFWMKTWPASQIEPKEWDHSNYNFTNYTASQSALVGILAYRSAEVEINWIGASTEGGRAPLAVV